MDPKLSLKTKINEEALINKTMHNLIEERDNIMSGMYDHKLTVSVGTDPREQILMNDSDTQYRKDDFMPGMNKAIKEGE